MKKFEIIIGLDEDGDMGFIIEVNESPLEAIVDFLHAHNQINKAAKCFLDKFFEEKNNA